MRTPRLRQVIFGGATAAVAGFLAWAGFVLAPALAETALAEHRAELAGIAARVATRTAEWRDAAARSAQVVAGFPTTREIVARPAGRTSAQLAHLTSVLEGLRRDLALSGAWIVADGQALVAAGPAGGPVPEAAREAGLAAMASGRLELRRVAAGGLAGPIVLAVPCGPPRGERWDGAAVIAVSPDGLDRIAGIRAVHGPGIQCALGDPSSGGWCDVVDPGAVPSALTAAVAAAVTVGRTVPEQLDDGAGQPHLVASRRVAGTPWFVVTSQSADTALSSFREGLVAAGALIGAVLAAAGGVTWGVLRSRAAASRAEIARSDVRFARLVEQMGDAMFVMAADGTLLEVAGQTEALYGRRPEEFRGLHASVLRPPELRPAVEATIARTTTTPETLYETVHVRADGTTFPVECSTRLLSPDGDERVIAVVRDIGRRKREAAELERVNRFLRTLSEVNQLICRETDRARLIESACVAIAEHSGFRAAWIGFADRATGRIEPVAQGGVAVEYLRHLEIRCDDTPAGRGPAGACIRSGRPEFVADVTSDERTAHFRAHALRYDIRSIGAAPIVLDGEARGALVVCGREPGECGGEMLDLVAQVAGDIAFALHVIDDRARVERARQIADEALRRSERQARDRARDLETLVDTVPVGVWISRDAECRTATGNPAMHRLTGVAPGGDLGLEALLSPGSPVEGVFHAGLPAGPLEFPPLVAARTGAPVGPVFEEIVLRDGRRMHTVGHAAPLRGDDGRVIGAVGALVDVTEVVEVRRELEILRRAIEQSPASVVITDATGAIEYVNRRFTEVTGYTSEEARGKNPRVLKSGETPAETYAQLWARIRSGHEWRGWFHNRAKDGRTFTEFAVISPIVDPAGRVTHYLAVKEDVTDRLATQAELAEAQRALVQAQKMEAVGRLAGGVAHDFNNMLAIVMGYTELALSAMRPDDPLRAQLEQVSDAAERASRLTRQLLAFSRRQVIEPRVLDLNDLVAGLAKMLRRLIGEDIDLDVILAPDLGRIRADPGQIEQVLVNLAVNSRDAMPHGGRLVISTANEDVPADLTGGPGTAAGPDAGPPPAGAAPLPSRTVRISVSDTGTGIPPDIRDRIFDPFFTTKPAGKGTGLGLATVYGIVRQSGGTIRLETEPGRGTAFHILLPRVEGPAEGTGPEDSERPHLAARTILLVEDDAAVRTLATRMVESLGHRVISAGGPDDALRIAAGLAEPIDLLLTDVVMPGMDGHQLARRIAARIVGGRVLFMSGYLEGDLAHSAELPAGTHLLRKPFTLDVLAKKLREALEAPPAAR